MSAVVRTGRQTAGSALHPEKYAYMEWGQLPSIDDFVRRFRERVGSTMRVGTCDLGAEETFGFLLDMRAIAREQGDTLARRVATLVMARLGIIWV